MFSSKEDLFLLQEEIDHYALHNLVESLVSIAIKKGISNKQMLEIVCDAFEQDINSVSTYKKDNG